MEKQRIPADFLIGTSSSAWQIEGCAGKKEGQESWAELFYNTNPEIWYDDVGPKKASDFYHHYKEDIKTMASFGMTGFRFTIQWARFMKDPIAGIVDNDAVEFYRDVIHEIKKNGMKPVISLEHWDIPAILFEKYNGWVGRETVYLYEQYVKAVLKEFHKEVKLWFAFTEPNIPIDNGYMDGIWYPFKHAPKEAYQAHFHKILATTKAVKAIKPYKEDGCRLGVMLHMTPIYARSGEARDVQAAYYADLFQVRIYLNPYLKGEFPQELLRKLEEHDCMFAYEQADFEDIKKYRIDMLGIDYYFPIRVKARETAYDKDVFHPEFYYEPWEMPGRKYNANRGWEIYEEAVVDIGMRIKEDYGNIPWFISENGIGIEGEDRYRNKEGYIDDDYRIDFLKGHLQRALKVRNMGSNCFGYFVWSFVDNLSAINAFKNRYGLLELDLKTGNRIPKKSLYWFKEIMKDREV